MMDISFFVFPVSKTALKYRCQDYGMKYTAKIKQTSNQKKFLWGLPFKHIAQTLISFVFCYKVWFLTRFFFCDGNDWCVGPKFVMGNPRQNRFFNRNYVMLIKQTHTTFGNSIYWTPRALHLTNHKKRKNVSFVEILKKKMSGHRGSLDSKNKSRHAIESW